MAEVAEWWRAANRYAIFLVLIVLAELSPALPHAITPDIRWWSLSAGLLVIMVACGWLGVQRRPGHWLNTVAPLLLFPAVHALRCADGNSTSGFTPLMLLPVLWFALYGRMRDVVLAVIGVALTLALPMIVLGAPQFPRTGWRGSLLLVILAATIGPLVRRLVETTARANRAVSRSEVEFRAAFEGAPVGMAITALRGPMAYHFVRVNHALCALFGRTEQELTSLSIEELSHPEDREFTRESFAVATDPGTTRRVDKRYLHRSGRPIWASVSYSVVYDEQGEPSHLISQIEDISSRRESDQALLDAYETDREATEQLKQIERVRTEMASTVSHELRTPLTSAAGYVELLAEGDAGPLTAEQRSMLDTVARSLTRLDGIVDDVLEMATGKQAKRRDVATAELGAVLDGAVASVALQAATRGQDLITHNGLNGAVVAGDPGRLERLLVNLLTNAVKFTPEDGTITVTATRADDAATIAVRDNGIGISPADQDRIFERFFRADRGVDSATPGTGLGLAIVHTITTQYGGTIAVDSELGNGSTFTVSLPLRKTP